MTFTLAQWLSDAVNELTEAGVPQPEVDALLLAAHVRECSLGELKVDALLESELSSEQRRELDLLLARRVRREPLQHITGVAPFRSLELAVGPGVFVPRPETETVTQIAIDAARAVPASEPRIVDLGTGSAAIALAIAVEVPSSAVWAVEKHSAALGWARRNIDTWGQGRVTLVEADFSTALTELDGTVDVVISNPPYIPAGAIPRDVEVREFDPPSALYGGPDGLDDIRAISRRARDLLHSGGLLVIEHGENQSSEIAEILRRDKWSAIAHHRDLTQRDRATTAIR